MGTVVARSVKVFTNLLQRAGPYLLLLLPGGTLLALLLFLYQRRVPFDAATTLRVSAVIARAIGTEHKEIIWVALRQGIASVWRGRHQGRNDPEGLARAREADANSSRAPAREIAVHPVQEKPSAHQTASADPRW